jgi:hypothetical protein
MKIHFIINLMVFIWYHKYGYIFSIPNNKEAKFLTPYFFVRPPHHSS